MATEVRPSARPPHLRERNLTSQHETSCGATRWHLGIVVLDSVSCPLQTWGCMARSAVNPPGKRCFLKRARSALNNDMFKRLTKQELLSTKDRASPAFPHSILLSETPAHQYLTIGRLQMTPNGPHSSCSERNFTAEEIHDVEGAAVSLLLWKLSERPDFPSPRPENLLCSEYIWHAASPFFTPSQPLMQGSILTKELGFKNKKTKNPILGNKFFRAGLSSVFPVLSR